MRILLDGQFFAEGDSLEAMAEVSGLPVLRFSFALDDLKSNRRAELSREATRRIRALFPDTPPSDVALEALLLIGTNDPRVAQMRTIKTTLDARRLSVDAAATQAAVLAVVW